MICLFFLILSVSAQTDLLNNGNGVGNGGDAIVCATKIELLDFVEARLKGEKLLIGTEKDFTTIVTKKIENLKLVDEKLFRQYSKVFAGLDKRLKFIPGANFRDVPDSLEIAIPKNCMVKQLAIQRFEGNQKLIHVSKDLWDKMDVNSQAGLILHEIIFEHFILLGEKDSVKTRAFNSLLFSEKIEKMNRTEYLKFTRELGIKLY